MTALDPQRALQLRFQGDWGGANLTRVCGWIAQGLGERTAPGTRSCIWTGTGMGDNLIAVSQGEVDVAVSTPGAFAEMARTGKGPFEDQPLSGLRAVGVIPHDDAMLVAIATKHGVKTFAELREKKPELKLALAPNDGQNFMGFGAHAILTASGISPAEIEHWGGELVYSPGPIEALNDVMSGKADSIIQEAIMTPWWRDITEKFDFEYLSLEKDAEQSLRDDYSLGALTVKAGRLRGIDHDVRALDFDGWIVLVREDMRDDLAGLIATVMVESAGMFEWPYRNTPVELSPLTYPITAEKLAKSPVPLHSGAEAYYRSIAALPS